MSLLVKLAVFALCAYAAILLAAYFGQRRLMYFPDRAYTRPAEVGLTDVEERVLKTPDGARVIAWYGKAQPGKPTLLYFHGNAGSLAVRAERIRRFMGEGWGVCMMSYRGYSGSNGSPTETANVADARLAYGALVQEGVEPASIILYGESLGHQASRCGWPRSGRSAGSFSTRPIRRSSRWPRRPIPSCRCATSSSTATRPTKYIAQVRTPLLILHGERDPVIPVAMGRELLQLANEPKRLVTFPIAGHSNLYVDGNAALGAVRAWIGELKLPKLN